MIGWRFCLWQFFQTFAGEEIVDFMLYLNSCTPVNPLYTSNGFFLLIWYNKLGIVHCTYIGVSGYYLKRMYFILRSFYAPNFEKKLKVHIALGLSVLLFVRPLQKLSYSFEIS